MLSFLPRALVARGIWKASWLRCDAFPVYLLGSVRVVVAEPAVTDVGGFVLVEIAMAVRIRLKRIGRRHRPSYRVTAVDRRRAPSSKVLEELGSYDPICEQEDRRVVLNRERIEYWLSVGATPSAVVRNLLKEQGIGTGSS